MRLFRLFFRCFVLVLGLLLFAGIVVQAQVATSSKDGEVEELRQTVRDLALRVAVLEEQLQKRPTAVVASPNADAAGGPAASSSSSSAVADAAPMVDAVTNVSAAAPAALVKSSGPATGGSSHVALGDVLPAQLPGGATLNYYVDGYYGYDFNHPIGRVQYLRAYDVLSNAFSLNQAGVVLALDPAVEEGRRYGVRLDLQFGQATETLQGNPANEPRPEIYRNIFQAYGTYVFPVGRGLTVDFGKWASSIGLEGNYTKDQMNYSRSFWFDYLPFYHMGVRANYKINDKVSANYWIVNGTDQSEPTNSFKDQLFGVVLQPKKNVSWTVNYYLGQDHPDVTQVQDCGTAPVQPGLCLVPITPAPDGKGHIFDSYATWNVTPKVTLALEGDYVISREWAQAGPGMSSAPKHVTGGAGYARYQWTPRMSLAGRGEYLSDRGGLFSGTTQALKEFTGTYEFKVGEGLLSRVEYRRDWSNVPFFLTNKVGVLSANQDTLTVGLVWWYGGKQGVW
ncbi:MAG TPA: outer membrane beta-barrel protein [Edaphobacter sp.]|nr:outer membrane beta-barrel protein [Edaphobacter sp.]